MFLQVPIGFAVAFIFFVYQKSILVTWRYAKNDVDYNSGEKKASHAGMHLFNVHPNLLFHTPFS